MTMSTHRDRMTDHAALWFVRAQDPDFSRADREEFASWLAGSAEHVLEYLSLAAVSRDIHEASENLDVDALVALARQSGDDDNVVALMPRGMSVGKDHGESRNRVPRPALWAAAAGLMITLLAGFWLSWSTSTVVHSTVVGEQLSFPLPDGSVVTLNARSLVEVHYTKSERMVRLVAGEALFEVEEDPDRPFRVVTERAMIQALGTSFNVRHREERTTVTVVEGIVDVRPLDEPGEDNGIGRETSDDADAKTPWPANARSVRLTAGQQVLMDSQTARVTVTEADVADTTSWRERRLVFEARALSDVVSEFNLYSDRRIEIEDPDLASVLISGAFDADDPESFALFLSGAGIAAVEQDARGLISLRTPPEAR